MKFSYNWLKQLVGFNKTPQELADELSLKSIEIEGIEQVGGEYLKTVVVGEVVSCEKHPDADRLQVCQVSFYSAQDDISRDPISGHFPRSDLGKKTTQIVCGAPNARTGIRVAVALPGTILPKGEIKVSKIRGVESGGMLCGADELEIGPATGGIMELPLDIPIGSSLYDIFSDTVLDGAILPNRGDLGSHLGIAREIRAIYGGKYQISNIKYQNNEVTTSNTENQNSIKIEIEADDACPLYQACLVKNIVVAPSPLWMQARLVACGIKPINNIVDITNFVMLAVGSPMHAFDADKINDPKTSDTIEISVRNSRKGEKIMTLDGVKRELPDGVLVIADSKKPIAIAGVIGGEETGVAHETTNIVLEAASFGAPTVRKSQLELGISTESSQRFAKGLSPQLATGAMEMAISLILENVPEAKASQVVRVGHYQESKLTININPDQIKQLIAQDVSHEEMIDILIGLGFGVRQSGSTWEVAVPAWREDVTIWQDIAEEIARIYGLEKVPEILAQTSVKPKEQRMILVDQAVKQYFSSRFWNEVLSYSFINEKMSSPFSSTYPHFFEVSNPLPDGNKIMRSSLIPGLVHTASENLKREKRLAFFEVSKVYQKSQDPDFSDFEPRRLTLAFSDVGDKGWVTVRHALDLFCRDHGIIFEYRQWSGSEIAHPGRVAQILYNSQPIGETYELHPSVLEYFDSKQRIWVAEIDLSYISLFLQNIPGQFQEKISEVKYQEFSRFEVARRDLAVLVDEDISPDEIRNDILHISDMIITVELFDDFRGEGIEKGKKSLGYHLTFQAPDHTMTEEEISKLLSSVISKVKNQYKAIIR